MKKLVFFILFLILFLGFVFSKTFLYYPTSHFDIYFSEETKEQAVQLIEQGNEIYETLSDFYNVELKEKLRVYLLDVVDFSNAYADFFSNAVVIYVNRSAVDYYDNSFKWWVPFVFSHELTHILIANKANWLKNALGIFGHPVSMLFDTAFTPSYFHEGVAIFSESFFSEKGRLNDDRYLSYLSAEIQDSSFKGFTLGASMNSPSFTPTGYNYLYGAFFVQYIEETYGSEKVAEMVDAYGKTYHFDLMKMVESISGKDFGAFLLDWKNWLQQKTSYQNHIKDNFRCENISQSGFYSGMNATNDEALYYIMQKESEETSIIRKTKTGEIKKNFPIPNAFDVSQSGRMACILNNSDGLEKYDLYLFIDNDNGQLRKVKGIERPKTVSWQNDEVLVYTYLDKGGTGLVSYNTITKERKTYLFPNADYFINNISIEGTACYMSISFEGNSDIYKLDLKTAEVFQITQTPQNEIDVFVKDSILYFSSNRESFTSGELSPYDIYMLDMNDNTVKKITNTLWGAYNPIFYNGAVYYRGYSGKGFDLYKIAVPSDIMIEDYTVKEGQVQKQAFDMEEDIVLTNFINDLDSKRVLLPIPRFGLPFVFPLDDELIGVAGIAGWDDLKEWIWYGYYIGIPKYRKWDYSLIHRGLPDVTFTWNGDSDFEIIQTSVKVPMYLRESEKYLLVRPGLDFGYFHTSQNLDFRFIADASLYWSADYIGYPDNPVKVPEFFQLIQVGTSGFYSQSGIGMALPFSCTGLLRQRTSNGDLRITSEAWFPFSNFKPVGTPDGKFKLSSFTLHLAENIDIDETLRFNPSTTIGLWIDLGVQYWLDLKLIIDFEIDSNGFKPIFSIQNSIL